MDGLSSRRVALPWNTPGEFVVVALCALLAAVLAETALLHYRRHAL